MLAVCTYTSLVLLDPPALKRPPTTVSPRCTLPSSPTASTWAPDNSALFIANDNTIRRFDPAGTLLATIDRGHPVATLACKDNGNTIIYSSHDEIVVLDAASGTVAYTLDTHGEPVTGLALSSDASLLASTSRPSEGGPGSVHIHNLSSAASHTVLKGLPSPGIITACAFHAHTKNKLLLGVDGQLVVYDITKPNAPLKTVQLEKTPSAVVAITCSPFSKTLIAVGCASGTVHLVDLDKEKGLFRTLPIHAPLTALVFSPEGAALYAGADNGKVLILDLRALDKPPKSIVVSPEGQPVVCMAVQRKLKPGERTSATASALTKRRVGADTTNLTPESKASGSTPLKTKLSNPRLNSALAARMPRTRTISTTSSTPGKPSSTLKADPTKSTPPTRTRTISTQSVSPKPPVPTVPAPVRIRTTSSGTSASSRVTSASSTISRSTKLSSATSVTSSGISSPIARKSGISIRKPRTPPKSPLGDNGDTDATTRPFPSTKRPAVTGDEENTARPATRPSAVRIRTTSAASSRSTSTRVPSGSGPARSTLSTTATLSPAGKLRPRTTSSTNAAALKPRPGPSSRPLSVVSPSHTALSLSPIPPVPSLPAEFRDGEQLTEINIRWEASRTPSPANDEEDPPDTPLPARMKGKEKEKPVENLALKPGKTNVLGLGTPELKRWIEADRPPEAKWEERKIAMVHEPENDVQIESIVVVGEDDGGGGAVASGSGDGLKEGPATHADRAVRMTVQISPRRPPPNPLAGWAPAKSPLNPTADGSSASTPVNSAHDLLHSLIRDAMYDFRRETKAEIIGLHLDLVRMGRSWRKEMRESLDRWGEELNEVRRENDLLRQENERLRRGY